MEPGSVVKNFDPFEDALAGLGPGGRQLPCSSLWGHFGSFWSFLTKMNARHKKVFWTILDRFWAVLGCFGHFDPKWPNNCSLLPVSPVWPFATAWRGCVGAAGARDRAPQAPL